MQQQNALSAFLRENGEGLMAGDQNAFAQYAQFDPMAAFNMQTQNRNNARADRQLELQESRDVRQDANSERDYQLRAAEYARKVGAEQAAAEAVQIEQAVRMGLAAQTPQEWDQIVTQAGAPNLVGQFDNRQALSNRYLEVADILKQQAGPTPLSSPGKVKADIDAGLLPEGTPLQGAGQRINVSTGTVPQGYQNIYDDNGNLIRQEPIPGGPAAREIEASDAAREGMQGMTARQLNPTLDDITTARDLAEGGVGTTGMFSGMIQRIPGIGQDSVDMAATIDAIGSGISLENLNQMRQNSPTGGALGNVSDKQSSLQSEAFGSLRQSMSKGQFLYNLARVENTLNDIVHGEGNGPDRHDMNGLRGKYLRGGANEAALQASPSATSGSVEAPMSKEQYDALPSGARFQAPDGSIRIKP